MNRSPLLVSLILVVVLVLGASIAGAQEEITLRVLTHWGEEIVLPGQLAMIEAYEAANPGVKIELETVPFNDLLTKIITGQTAGTNPDIFHLYNLWLPEFTRSGLLAVPPQEVVDAIVANTSPGIVEGVSAGGQVWGWPTEVNTYLLIYNKRLLEEAGYSEPPQNWEELREMAAAMTVTDDTGAITQAGFAVWPGWDSGIVHPFASLLMSNGGRYLTEDLSATAFNSPEGLETLQLYADLLADGSLDISVPSGEFVNGRVGMTIMANWWRATLRAAEAIDYDTEVGVAPIPVGPSGSETATMSYNWLWSVASTSEHPEVAWDFIQWMNTPPAEGEPSPMGDYLVHSLGAIPSMIYDQEAFSEELGDHFLAPFVASTAYAVPEPIAAGGQEVKTKLQAEIEAVLSGMQDPASALEFAAMEGDAVLAEYAAQ
ncbi:MAG: sugar ABC transporter substrate-binding protein [Chloroflexota bacterium]|nr:MAG: hypothetical protein DIU68_09305 [Chloroflexota bacterium]